MKTLLFYDTETTGLPDWKAPSEAAHQPHIVQLAAKLVDAETRESIDTMNLLVYPESWEIPQETIDVHGITMERAKAEGVKEADAVNAFLNYFWKRDNRLAMRVAHNESFDARILRSATLRYYPEDEMLHALWKGGRALCTQTMSDAVMKLPPTDKMKAAGFKKSKAPKLTEAYEHFIGEPMKGAHNAMADVLACEKVFWAIKDAELAREAA